MPTQDTIDARRMFRQISNEARTAFCLGDIDFEDVCPFEVTERQRFLIVNLLDDWGTANEIGDVDDA